VGFEGRSTPYRGEGWLAIRLEEARSAYEARIPRVPAVFHRVIARRLSRIGAGVSGIVGAVTVGVVALLGHVADAPVERLLSMTLRGAWAAMLVGALVGWALGRSFGRAHLDSLAAGISQRITRNGLASAVEALERRGPAGDLDCLARKMETLSVALPLVAVCLLGPLTIHYAVWLLYNLTAVSLPLQIAAVDRDFGDWIQLSLLIVGHCHILLAWMAWQAGATTPRMPSEALTSDGLSQGLRALGLVTLLSILPGVVLCLVPTALVLITGVFAPLAFVYFRSRVRHERWALSQAMAARLA
jgi:hypothetical protein